MSGASGKPAVLHHNAQAKACPLCHEKPQLALRFKVLGCITDADPPSNSSPREVPYRPRPPCPILDEAAKALALATYMAGKNPESEELRFHKQVCENRWFALDLYARKHCDGGREQAGGNSPQAIKQEDAVGRQPDQGKP